MSFSQAFTQGPRFKGTATVYFEKLIKDILLAYQNKQAIQVNYNVADAMIITANNNLYNLTELLHHHPDFEQLTFSEKDLALYDQFLRDPATTFGHIELDSYLDKKQFDAIHHAFPNLSAAELSPIRHYTGSFYAPIYFLLKHDAAKPFPKQDELGGTIYEMNLVYTFLNFARKLHGEQIEDYDPQDPVLLVNVIREILLHMAFACSALSKPVQSELNICIAASQSDLEKNQNKMVGISLVLVPNGALYDVYSVAYGKIVSKTRHSIDLRSLFDSSYAVRILSPKETQEIWTELKSFSEFSWLDALLPLTRTKLIGMLTNLDEVSDLLNEEVIRVEEDVPFFNSEYIPAIFRNLHTNRSFQFTKGFDSTSLELLEYFMSEGLNVITTLVNPITFGCNIESISWYPNEKERLFLPNQQIAYTAATKVNENRIELRGYPIRSIDGIDPFSYSPQPIVDLEKKMSAMLFAKPAVKAKKDEKVALLSAVKELIVELSGEISSWWPYPYKDRKRAKIEALKKIEKLMSKPMELLAYISYLENSNPEVLAGKISTRTHDLISEIKVWALRKSLVNDKKILEKVMP